ncbi:hypothetical protein NL676_007136 [Syzygium grande]|nr:hypothetical protein NL676_007136 [Syzygium grande]
MSDPVPCRDLAISGRPVFRRDLEGRVDRRSYGGDTGDSSAALTEGMRWAKRAGVGRGASRRHEVGLPSGSRRLSEPV